METNKNIKDTSHENSCSNKNSSVNPSEFEEAEKEVTSEVDNKGKIKGEFENIKSHDDELCDLDVKDETPHGSTRETSRNATAIHTMNSGANPEKAEAMNDSPPDLVLFLKEGRGRAQTYSDPPILDPETVATHKQTRVPEDPVTPISKKTIPEKKDQNKLFEERKTTVMETPESPQDLLRGNRPIQTIGKESSESESKEAESASKGTAIIENEEDTAMKIYRIESLEEGDITTKSTGTPTREAEETDKGSSCYESEEKTVKHVHNEESSEGNKNSKLLDTSTRSDEEQQTVASKCNIGKGNSSDELELRTMAENKLCALNEDAFDESINYSNLTSILNKMGKNVADKRIPVVIMSNSEKEAKNDTAKPKSKKKVSEKNLHTGVLKMVTPMNQPLQEETQLHRANDDSDNDTTVSLPEGEFQTSDQEANQKKGYYSLYLSSDAESGDDVIVLKMKNDFKNNEDESKSANKNRKKKSEDEESRTGDSEDEIIHVKDNQMKRSKIGNFDKSRVEESKDDVKSDSRTRSENEINSNKNRTGNSILGEKSSIENEKLEDEETTFGNMEQTETEGVSSGVLRPKEAAAGGLSESDALKVIQENSSSKEKHTFVSYSSEKLEMSSKPTVPSQVITGSRPCSVLPKSFTLPIITGSQGQPNLLSRSLSSSPQVSPVSPKTATSKSNLKSYQVTPPAKQSYLSSFKKGLVVSHVIPTPNSSQINKSSQAISLTIPSSHLTPVQSSPVMLHKSQMKLGSVGSSKVVLSHISPNPFSSSINFNVATSSISSNQVLSRVASTTGSTSLNSSGGVTQSEIMPASGVSSSHHGQSTSSCIINKSKDGNVKGSVKFSNFASNKMLMNTKATSTAKTSKEEISKQDVSIKLTKVIPNLLRKRLQGSQDSALEASTSSSHKNPMLDYTDIETEEVVLGENEDSMGQIDNVGDLPERIDLLAHETLFNSSSEDSCTLPDLAVGSKKESLSPEGRVALDHSYSSGGSSGSRKKSPTTYEKSLTPRPVYSNASPVKRSMDIMLHNDKINILRQMSQIFNDEKPPANLLSDEKNSCLDTDFDISLSSSDGDEETHSFMKPIEHRAAKSSFKTMNYVLADLGGKNISRNKTFACSTFKNENETASAPTHDGFTSSKVASSHNLATQNISNSLKSFGISSKVGSTVVNASSNQEKNSELMETPPQKERNRKALQEIGCFVQYSPFLGFPDSDPKVHHVPAYPISLNEKILVQSKVGPEGEMIDIIDGFSFVSFASEEEMMCYDGTYSGATRTRRYWLRRKRRKRKKFIRFKGRVEKPYQKMLYHEPTPSVDQTAASPKEAGPTTECGAFASDDLDLFLDKNSHLNISYQIPKCQVTEDGVTKMDEDVVEPGPPPEIQSSPQSPPHSPQPPQSPPDTPRPPSPETMPSTTQIVGPVQPSPKSSANELTESELVPQYEEVNAVDILYPKEKYKYYYDKDLCKETEADGSNVFVQRAGKLVPLTTVFKSQKNSDLEKPSNNNTEFVELVYVYDGGKLLTLGGSLTKINPSNSHCVRARVVLPIGVPPIAKGETVDAQAKKVQAVEINEDMAKFALSALQSSPSKSEETAVDIKNQSKLLEPLHRPSSRRGADEVGKDNPSAAPLNMNEEVSKEAPSTLPIKPTKRNILDIIAAKLAMSDDESDEKERDEEKVEKSAMKLPEEANDIDTNGATNSESKYGEKKMEHGTVKSPEMIVSLNQEGLKKEKSKEAKVSMLEDSIPTSLKSETKFDNDPSLAKDDAGSRSVEGEERNKDSVCVKKIREEHDGKNSKINNPETDVTEEYEEQVIPKEQQKRGRFSYRNEDILFEQKSNGDNVLTDDKINEKRNSVRQEEEFNMIYEFQEKNASPPMEKEAAKTKLLVGALEGKTADSIIEACNEKSEDKLPGSGDGSKAKYAINDFACKGVGENSKNTSLSSSETSPDKTYREEKDSALESEGLEAFRMDAKSKIFKRNVYRFPSLSREMKRLNMNFVNYEPAPHEVAPTELEEETKNVPEECTNEYCQLGCVCDSLKCLRRSVEHCGRIECMFECSCRDESWKLASSSGRSMNAVSIFNLDREQKEGLALREKDFKRTIIQNGTEVILVGAERKKREIRLPGRYRGTTMWAPSEYMENIGSCLEPSELPCLPDSPGIPVSEASKYTKNFKLNIPWFDIKNISVWCMDHSCYDCSCLTDPTFGEAIQVETPLKVPILNPNPKNIPVKSCEPIIGIPNELDELPEDKTRKTVEETEEKVPLVSDAHCSVMNVIVNNSETRRKYTWKLKEWYHHTDFFCARTAGYTKSMTTEETKDMTLSGHHARDTTPEEIVESVVRTLRQDKQSEELKLPSLSCGNNFEPFMGDSLTNLQNAIGLDTGSIKSIKSDTPGNEFDSPNGNVEKTPTRKKKKKPSKKSDHEFSRDLTRIIKRKLGEPEVSPAKKACKSKPEKGAVVSRRGKSIKKSGGMETDITPITKRVPKKTVSLLEMMIEEENRGELELDLTNNVPGTALLVAESRFRKLVNMNIVGVIGINKAGRCIIGTVNSDEALLVMHQIQSMIRSNTLDVGPNMREIFYPPVHNSMRPRYVMLRCDSNRKWEIVGVVQKKGPLPSPSKTPEHKMKVPSPAKADMPQVIDLADEETQKQHPLTDIKQESVSDFIEPPSPDEKDNGAWEGSLPMIASVHSASDSNMAELIGLPELTQDKSEELCTEDSQFKQGIAPPPTQNTESNINHGSSLDIIPISYPHPSSLVTKDKMESSKDSLFKQGIAPPPTQNTGSNINPASSLDIIPVSYPHPSSLVTKDKMESSKDSLFKQRIAPPPTQNTGSNVVPVSALDIIPISYKHPSSLVTKDKMESSKDSPFKQRIAPPPTQNTGSNVVPVSALDIIPVSYPNPSSLVTKDKMESSKDSPFKQIIALPPTQNTGSNVVPVSALDIIPISYPHPSSLVTKDKMESSSLKTHTTSCANPSQKLYILSTSRTISPSTMTTHINTPMKSIVVNSASNKVFGNSTDNTVLASKSLNVGKKISYLFPQLSGHDTNNLLVQKLPKTNIPEGQDSNPGQVAPVSAPPSASSSKPMLIPVTSSCVPKVLLVPSVSSGSSQHMMVLPAQDTSGTNTTTTITPSTVSSSAITTTKVKMVLVPSAQDGSKMILLPAAACNDATTGASYNVNASEKEQKKMLVLAPFVSRDASSVASNQGTLFLPLHNTVLPTKPPQLTEAASHSNIKKDSLNLKDKSDVVFVIDPTSKRCSTVDTATSDSKEVQKEMSATVPAPAPAVSNRRVAETNVVSSLTTITSTLPEENESTKTASTLEETSQDQQPLRADTLNTLLNKTHEEMVTGTKGIEKTLTEESTKANIEEGESSASNYFICGEDSDPAKKGDTEDMRKKQLLIKKGGFHWSAVDLSIDFKSVKLEWLLGTIRKNVLINIYRMSKKTQSPVTLSVKNGASTSMLYGFARLSQTNNFPILILGSVVSAVLCSSSVPDSLLFQVNSVKYFIREVTGELSSYTYCSEKHFIKLASKKRGSCGEMVGVGEQIEITKLRDPSFKSGTEQFATKDTKASGSHNTSGKHCRCNEAGHLMCTGDCASESSLKSGVAEWTSEGSSKASISRIPLDGEKQDHSSLALKGASWANMHTKEDHQLSFSSQLHASDHLASNQQIRSKTQPNLLQIQDRKREEKSNIEASAQSYVDEENSRIEASPPRYIEERGEPHPETLKNGDPETKHRLEDGDDIDVLGDHEASPVILNELRQQFEQETNEVHKMVHSITTSMDAARRKGKRKDPDVAPSIRSSPKRMKTASSSIGQEPAPRSRKSGMLKKIKREEGLSSAMMSALQEREEREFESLRQPSHMAHAQSSILEDAMSVDVEHTPDISTLNKDKMATLNARRSMLYEAITRSGRGEERNTDLHNKLERMRRKVMRQLFSHIQNIIVKIPGNGLLRDTGHHAKKAVLSAGQTVCQILRANERILIAEEQAVREERSSLIKHLAGIIGDADDSIKLKWRTWVRQNMQNPTAKQTFERSWEPFSLEKDILNRVLEESFDMEYDGGSSSPLLEGSPVMGSSSSQSSGQSSFHSNGQNSLHRSFHSNAQNYIFGSAHSSGRTMKRPPVRRILRRRGRRVGRPCKVQTGFSTQGVLEPGSVVPNSIILMAGTSSRGRKIVRKEDMNFVT